MGGVFVGTPGPMTLPIMGRWYSLPRQRSLVEGSVLVPSPWLFGLLRLHLFYIGVGSVQGGLPPELGPSWCPRKSIPVDTYVMKRSALDKSIEIFPASSQIDPQWEKPSFFQRFIDRRVFPGAVSTTPWSSARKLTSHPVMKAL